MPIPGTTKLNHREENLVGANISLSPAELQEIEHRLSSIELVGERLPTAALRMTGL